MKKSIIFIVVLALLTLGFTACEKESKGKTKITYYPTLELEGPAYAEIHVGDDYKEPGYTAILNGEDVTDQVIVAGPVDPKVAGFYQVTYTIFNEDGFSSSASRTVVVFDPNDPIQGHWACTPESFRTNTQTAADVAYGESFEIFICGNKGVGYYVNDLLAGWYDQRAGYGEDYAMTGIIDVAKDGTISLWTSYVPGWKDGANKLENGVFDADKKTIQYALTYAGYLVFNVTLNKVEEN